MSRLRRMVRHVSLTLQTCPECFDKLRRMAAACVMRLGHCPADYPAADGHAGLKICFKNPGFRAHADQQGTLMKLSSPHATGKLLFVRTVSFHFTNVHLKAAMIFASLDPSSLRVRARTTRITVAKVTFRNRLPMGYMGAVHLSPVEACPSSTTRAASKDPSGWN